MDLFKTDHAASADEIQHVNSQDASILGNDSEFSMIQLQSLIGQRSQMIDLTTQMIQSMGDTARTIIENMEGGDAGGRGQGGSNDNSHTDAGQDATQASNGGHPPGWPFVAANGENHHAGSARDFWSEAARPPPDHGAGTSLTDVVQHSTNGLDSSASQLEGHNGSAAVPGIDGHDASHDVAGILIAPVLPPDHAPMHVAFEITHATDFGTHLHL
jgi:hypothetical protein